LETTFEARLKSGFKLVECSLLQIPVAGDEFAGRLIHREFEITSIDLLPQLILSELIGDLLH
jgi:hypothetical protein